MTAYKDMPQVNPAILVWARETAKLTPEDAIRRLGIRATRRQSATDKLAALESGKTPPTRAMLVRMTHVYRRPLLTFYLSKPPRTGTRGEDFRLLPLDHEAADEALVDALIRDVRARQDIVRDLLEEEDEDDPLPFVGSVSPKAGVAAALDCLRKSLGVDRTVVRSSGSPEEAFRMLRESAERAGVYVLLQGDFGSHHTEISAETFRGFALADKVAPFIVINDRDSPSAWAFTLLHEFVHLCIGATGISGMRPDTDIERFCNDVASAFLLDDAELQTLNVRDTTELGIAAERISAFAQTRRISRSMVAYRLFRAGLISHARWRSLHEHFRDQWRRRKEQQREKARDTEGGPNYYVLRRHRLGDALLKLVRRKMHAGILTTTRAARVLAVRPQSVGTLFASLPAGDNRLS